SDLRDRPAGFLELFDLVDRDLALAALVDAGGLGFGDAFELAFFAQVGLELGKDAEHVEKALAGRGRGIDWLLCDSKDYASGLECADDVLQIADRAGEPVDSSDHKFVTLAHEFQQQLKFGAAVAAGAGRFFHSNYSAPGCFKGCFLDR